MPAIGDQVASLELDFHDALAKIQALTATNDALQSAHASLTTEHAALAVQHAAVIADNFALSKYADEIKAMVESVATSALDMLKTSKLPIVAAPAVVTAAKPTIGVLLTDADLTAIADTRPTVILPGNAPAVIVQGDSGDEQPEPVAPVAEPEPAAAPIAEPPINTFIAPPEGAAIDQAATDWATRAKSSFVGEVQTLEAEIARVPDAVNRMLHHSSAPPVTAISDDAHDQAGLPLFLRKGTAFEALTRDRIFG